MGHSYSCHTPDYHVSCPYAQEYLMCTAADGANKIQNGCRVTSHALGVQVFLPISLILFGLILTYMAYRYFRLRSIRRSQIGYSEVIAVQEGKFAGGSHAWSFQHDILPYISPCGLRNWCIIEPCDIKVILGIGCTLLFLSLLFIILAIFTIDAGNHDLPEVNNGNFGTAFLYCFLFGIGVCCFACILRSCGSRKEYRMEAARELTAQRTVVLEGVVLAQMNPSAAVGGQRGGYNQMPQQLQQPSPQMMASSLPVNMHMIPVGLPVEGAGVFHNNDAVIPHPYPPPPPVNNVSAAPYSGVPYSISQPLQSTETVDSTTVDLERQ